ncbi:MAG TPA: branched-chain amino acid ABC transporter permease [Gemmatimonadaceae bacterium]
MIAYGVFLLVLILQLGVLAQATDSLGGYAGRVGVQGVLFAAVGGYLYAFATVVLGVTPWLAVAYVVAAVFVLGWGAGSLFLRLRENDFLLATLAAQLCFLEVANNVPALGGPLGIRDVPLLPAFGVSGDAVVDALWILIPSAVLSTAILTAFLTALVTHLRVRTRRFKTFVPWIRDDAISAASLGLPKAWLLMTLFIVQAVFSATAGIGLVVSQGYVSPDAFDLSLSLTVLTVVYLSGTAGLPWVMFAGAFLVVTLNEGLRAVQSLPQLVGPVQQIAVNALLVLVLLVRRRGLAGPVLEPGPSATILE